MAKRTATPEQSMAPAAERDLSYTPPALDGGCGNAAACSTVTAPPHEKSALLDEVAADDEAKTVVDTENGTFTHAPAPTTTTSKGADGSTTKSTSSPQGTLTVNDGIAVSLTDKRSTERKDAAGNTSATSDSPTWSAGVVSKDGEHGGSVGAAQTTDVNGTSVTTGASGQVTNQGVAAKGTGQVGRTAKTDSTSVGAKGGITVGVSCTGKVVVVDGTYVLRAQASIALGASIGGEGKLGGKEQEGDAPPGFSNSLTAEAKGAAKLELDHRFTAAELAGYPQIVAAEKAGKVLSEKEILALGPAAGLRAFLDALYRGSNPRAVADADAALALPDGDGWALEMGLSHKLGGEVGLSAEAFGAGLAGELSGGSSSRVAVKREGTWLVVTVSFGEDSGDKVGGSTTVDGVTGTLTSANINTAAARRTYRIDTTKPDEAREQIDAILSASSSGEVQALDLDPLLKDVLESGESTQTTGGVDGMAMSFKGVTANAEFGETHTSTETMSRREGTTTTCTDALPAAVRLGNATIGGGVTSTATGHLRTDGTTSLDVATREENSGGVLPSELPSAWDVVESPGKAATDALTKKRTMEQRLHLRDGDLAQLVLRAQDGPKWRACVTLVMADADVAAEWERQRKALVHPSGATAVEQDLDRLRFLSSFVGQFGTSATDLLDAVARHWEDVGGEGPDLGSVDEFPPELAAEKIAFDDLFAGVADLVKLEDVPFVALTHQLMEAKRLQRVVAGAVIKPSVKADMLDRLSDAEETLQQMRTEVHGAPLGENVELDRILALLRAFQAQEAALFAKCERQMGGRGQTVGEKVTADKYEPAYTLREISELHQLWEKRAEDLRWVYKIEETPEEAWWVSPTPTPAPMRPLDPDYPKTVELSVHFERWIRE